MKAEHRKQLEKNELASRLEGLWKGPGGTKVSSTVWVVAGAIILVCVLIFAWQYYSNASQKNKSSQWRQLEQATDPKDLESIIDSNKGTPLAVAAKAQLARISLNDGLSKLNTQSQRESAIASIEKARELYGQVRKEGKDDKSLVREALLSEAKAEESLVGIPKSDNASESRGSLDRALELYQEEADKFGDTPQGKEAADRAKEIKENKQKIQQFYDELNKRFTVPELPKLPEPKFEPTTNPTNPLLPQPMKPTDPLPPPKSTTEPPAKSTPPATTPAKPAPPLAPPPKGDSPKSAKPDAVPPKTEAPKNDAPKIPSPPK